MPPRLCLVLTAIAAALALSAPPAAAAPAGAIRCQRVFALMHPAAPERMRALMVRRFAGCAVAGSGAWSPSSAAGRRHARSTWMGPAMMRDRGDGWPAAAVAAAAFAAALAGAALGAYAVLQRRGAAHT